MTTPTPHPIIACKPTGMIGDTPQWSFWCKFCRTYHRHGGKPDTNGEIGHRAAHCYVETSPYRATGYVLTTKAWLWEQSESRKEWSAGGLDPVGVYTIREVSPKKGPPRYHADVLTEVGSVAFKPEFRTLQSAQRFCESDHSEWRERQTIALAAQAITGRRSRRHDRCSIASPQIGWRRFVKKFAASKRRRPNCVMGSLPVILI